MPPGARGTGPIRPALDDLRCCHLRVGKEPPGSLFAWTVAAQPAQTHRLARNHLFEDRAPLIEAQITECPQRHLHGGSCRSVAAGQGTVLAPRRANEKCSDGPD